MSTNDTGYHEHCVRHGDIADSVPSEFDDILQWPWQRECLCSNSVASLPRYNLTCNTDIVMVENIPAWNEASELLPSQVEGNTSNPSSLSFEDHGQLLDGRPNFQVEQEFNTQLEDFDATVNLPTVTDSLQPHQPADPSVQFVVDVLHTADMAQSYPFLDASVQPSESPAGILDQSADDPSLLI